MAVGAGDGADGVVGVQRAQGVETRALSKGEGVLLARTERGSMNEDSSESMPGDSQTAELEGPRRPIKSTPTFVPPPTHIYQMETDFPRGSGSNE